MKHWTELSTTRDQTPCSARSAIFRLGALVACSAALISCQHSAEGSPEVPDQHPNSSSAALNGALPDECSQYPGYPKFRTELQHAVAGKSGEALRALFHPTGAMRVNGIGGRASTPDWGFGRPEAETVWAELEEILALGCASRDGKLYLPAMSAEGAEADQLVVLKSADVHALPRENAPILRSTRHGDRLMAYIHDQPAGWTQVLVKERVGYVRTEAVRSPSSFRLVLVPFEGGWRIREFGDGV